MAHSSLSQISRLLSMIISISRSFNDNNNTGELTGEQSMDDTSLIATLALFRS
jgi:hypothetical protein